MITRTATRLQFGSATTGSSVPSAHTPVGPASLESVPSVHSPLPHGPLSNTPIAPTGSGASVHSPLPHGPSTPVSPTSSVPNPQVAPSSSCQLGPVFIKPQLENMLGPEFKKLHLLMRKSSETSFCLPIPGGVVNEEEGLCSLNFADIVDCMNFDMLDISVLQIWTM